jgi:hypothetical protein
MYINHTVHVPHPIDDCVAAMARGPRTWFPDLKEDRTSRVGLSVAGLAVRKRVAVEIGNLIKDGNWAEVPIAWKVTAAGLFFPIFQGKMQLAPVDPIATRLSVGGMYEPPFGRFGLELDDAFMHNVAEGTLKDLAESISRRLEAANLLA